MHAGRKAALPARLSVAKDASLASVPGDGLLTPLSLLGLALWLFNDHVLQPYWPGVLSGKLGDVASLIALPIALQAALELFASRLRPSPFRPSRRLCVGACLSVGAFFAVMESTQLGSDVFRYLLGLLQLPLRCLRHGELVALRPVAHVADVEDLWTLPALLLPLRAGLTRANRARPSSSPGC